MQDLGLTPQQLVGMVTLVTLCVSFPFGLVLYTQHKRRKQEYLWVYGIDLRSSHYYGMYHKLHVAKVKPPAGNILYAVARLGNLQGGYHILSSFSQSVRSIAVHKPVVF